MRDAFKVLPTAIFPYTNEHGGPYVTKGNNLYIKGPKTELSQFILIKNTNTRDKYSSTASIYFMYQIYGQ